MTVVNNSNRVLIACVSSYGSAPTITGVTWNGDAMTAVPNSESYQSGSNNRTQIYYIIAPDTGTHNIVASFSGSATCGIGGMSFYNVNQTTPVGAGNTSSATSTATSSLALTPTVISSWIIAMISSSSGVGSATGLTQSYTEGSNAILRGGRNESPTIGSANTVGWGTASSSHAMSGCAIIPLDGDAKPTDIQDNSIFVETDTASRYWYDGTDWVLQEDWTPIELPNLHAWYDFSDSSTITESSSRVSQVNDKSGNNNHLTQGTSGSQPLLVSSYKNGRDVLDTVGSRSMLDTFTAYTNQPTICSVMFYPSDNGARQMFWNTDDFSNRAFYENQGNVNSTLSAYGGGNITFTGSSYDLSWNTTFIQYGSSGEIWVNNISKVSGSLGTQKPDSFRLGCDSDGTNYFSNTEYGEIIIVDGTISSVDRTKLESYLKKRWGL
jgi:hypothetical protein